MRSKDSAVLRAKWPTRQRALDILRDNPQGITPLNAAYRYDCYALTTYISDLRAAGANIWQKRTSDGKTFSYRLI